MTIKQTCEFNPIPATGIIAVHLLALLAFFYVSKGAIILCIVLFWLSGWIGIALCYHRLLTHYSFKTPKWFKCVLIIIGNLAWQGGPIKWVGNHRLHHRYSDTDQDPHSPKHGFSWAHVFWLFYKEPEGRDPLMAAGDLLKDKGICLIDKFFWVPQVFLTIILCIVGIILGGTKEAITLVVWGIGVRTILVYHITWFVNSASHTWGYKNKKVSDNSRNLWWVALFSGGEGWHSNHHAYPSCASHGRRWWEFDPVFITIWLLSLVGLTSHINTPSDDK